MYIHNYSRFVSPPVDDIKAYKQEISRYTDVKFRRANKFVLLSMVGASRCAHRQNIRTDTAVYLTTENGNLGDTETVLDQIFHKHEFPMPYNFINTMSNTASFYVAQSFDILGRNLVVSSKQLSFERGLELLRSDLAAGAVEEALIGGVDEVCFSKSQFEANFNRPYDDFQMVEGSCWFLIKAEKRGALGKISEIQSFGSLAQTENWLKCQKLKRQPILSCGMLIDLGQKESLGQAVPHEAEFDYISEYGYFDSATACGVSGFLDRYDKACLVHINKDCRGQYIVLIVQKY
ncbi:hypothetical protein ACFL2S_07235 [Thermodesulfobacteriota bacterium]